MFEVTAKLKRFAYILIAVGVLALGYGFIADAHRAWPALMVNNIFFLGISLIGTFFLGIQYIAQAGWSVQVNRIMQAMGSFLPITGGIMIVIIVAGGMHLHHMYHWMDTFITTEEVTVAELREHEAAMMHHGGGHGEEAHGEEAHGDDHGEEAHGDDHGEEAQGDDHGDGHGEEAHHNSHGEEAHGEDHGGGHHMYAADYEGIDGEEVIENPHYDSIIAGKTPFLNFGFFIIRAIIYLLGWIWATRLLRKLSIREDEVGGMDNYRKSVKISAIFTVFFAVTSSTMAWDWIMSIDTHWFSTLFGWYVFASMFVSGLTVMTMIAVYLKRHGYLENLNENHIHDLGKFMFAFSVFWTYLWFSQFMLIWYANIPEEVTYYMARFDDYKVPFFMALVLNFIMPLLVLMSRDSKRNFGFLITAGIIILFGHWLDFFCMIMPGTMKDGWHLGIVELGGLAGYAGLFILVVFNTLSKAPLIQKNHPMLKESELHHI